MKWVNNSAVTVFIPKLVLTIVIVVLAAPALLGRQANISTLAGARTSADRRAPLNPEVAARLFIGPGDLLTITIFNVPELQQTVRVSETGDGVLSLIGNMHLAGMTAADAAAALEDEYRNRKMLVDPHATVLVTEYATEGISVLGEVTKPGVYPLLGPHSLLDIISAAGGLTASAGSTVTIRRRNGAEQVVQLDANDPQKALAQDAELQPADMVVVARAAVVYVVGDVGKPGGFPMQNNGRLTVLQAIALASGVNKTASLSHAKIIHKDPSGYKEADIHLAKLLQGKAPDMALAPEDIVFVPNSKLKSAVAGGYASVVQAAANAAIYAVRP
jgi:polysaccharide export outer membrane protein